MKIILLASGTLESSLSARLVNIGKEMAIRGHDVVIIAPHLDKYTKFKSVKHKHIHGMRVIHPTQLSTKYQSLNFIPYLPTAAWHLLRLKADIIHIYKPTPLTIMGILGRSLVRTKIILDMDDIGSKVLVREKSVRWKVYAVKISEELAGRFAHGIITASSYLQDYYEDRFPNKHVIWVPNGVTRLDTGTAKHSAPIIFIGSLNDLEVITPLIKSIAEISRNKSLQRPLLQIIGDGIMRTDLIDYVTKLGIVDTILFSKGWVEFDCLSKLVTAGSLGYCCVPESDTYKAASNQKVFNYLSMGVIPVVNNIGDLPFYVDQGACGYIVTDNLTAALTAALKDDKERKTKSKVGQAYVQSNFFWSILGKRIEDFYAMQFNGQDKA